MVRAGIVDALAAAKAQDLPALCVEVGLQGAAHAEDAQEAFAGKARYVAQRIERLDRGRLLEVGDRVQQRRPTFALDEALRRVREGAPQLTELTRRAILDDLNMRLGLEALSGQLGLVTFLSRVWPLEEMPSEDHRCSDAAADISQHTENNADWDFEYLLTSRLRLLTASDYRFLRFLEEVLHPIVRPAPDQAALAALLNERLTTDGWRLAPTEAISGRPVYRAVRTGAAVDPVKNLVFASTGEKPDLVLANALTNEIRIVKHAEHCLIYDRPIPADGLRWTDLVAWWAERSGTPAGDVATERALYERLAASLDKGVERPFFHRFFTAFWTPLAGRLPALVPQVYLHYDPKSVRERARLAAAGPVPHAGAAEPARPLPRQRMDFLLLLPGQVRIVLELDGQQHYAVDATRNAAASPAKYADMVRADRDLRLDGYEVYRFGGHELQPARLDAVVDMFFSKLFERHGVAARRA